MAQETFEVVKRVLADGLSIGVESITLEANISDDLGADSLDAVELIMSLEEEFGIEIGPDAAGELKTVDDLVKLVDSIKA
jgi:acyl carrier protein